MRRFALFAVAALSMLVLAGCTGGAPIGAQEVDSPPANDSLAADPNVSDPATDERGWEAGYWYDEALSIDASDGLNQSELRAVVARAMARVEQVRDVEFERTVPVELVNRSTYGDTNQPSSEESEAQRIAAAEQAARYEALFVVGERADAGEEERQTRQASVQGYYSTREDRIVIVSDSETPRMAEVTLAQELFHAYQFRHALRETPFPQNPTADEVTGLLSLIEGDANLVDRLYEQRCDEDWDCLRRGGGGSGSGSGDGDNGDGGNGDGGSRDGGNGDGDDDGGDGEGGERSQSGESSVNMGIYLLSYFPYAEGEAMVQDVYEREGWDGVDALYADPPRSSEQVIHWGDGRDGPRSVSVQDRSAGGWERVGGDTAGVTVGESGVAAMFAHTLYDDRNGTLVSRDAFVNTDADGNVNATNPLNYDLPASAGWGGDRLYAYRNGDESAYVWRTEWDSPAEAREFADAYRRLLGYHGATRHGDGVFVVADGPYADAFSVRVSGDAVTIVNAPDRSALSAVHGGVGEKSASVESLAQGASNSTACGTSPPSSASSCS